MAPDLIELLFRPDAFFQKRAAEPENLVFPAIIILAGAIIAAASGYLASSMTTQMMGLAGFGPGLVLILSVIGAFVGVFIYWAIITGIFYLISLLFEGKGTFARSLETIGYGFLPLVLGYLVTLATGLVYIPRITAEHLFQGSLSDPAAAVSATQAFMNNPVVVQYTRITMIVAIIFLLWSTYCWIFGMKHARQLTARNAAICVGAPVLIYILYLLSVLFLFSTFFAS